VVFLRKNGTIFWGVPPVVAPEGGLVFWGKPSRPLALLTRCYLHLCRQLGCWALLFRTENLEILAKDRSDVAAGCSKRW
jgi:hypothetical protein